jgi:hypothetical protein
MCITLTVPRPSKADLFGGDVAVLVQILANALKQLYELQRLVQAGQSTLYLLRDINQGINDSLKLIKSLPDNPDPGIYGDLSQLKDILDRLNKSYGQTIDSPDKEAFESTDQTVAEAIRMNTELYEYTNQLDAVGEEVKQYSHKVSPGGAAKLTAQTLGVMIHVMNQQLRAQGTSMKLDAQRLAMENKKEKQSTEAYLKQADTLKIAMKTNVPSFKLPRF